MHHTQENITLYTTKVKFFRAVPSLPTLISLLYSQLDLSISILYDFRKKMTELRQLQSSV